ncbi:glutathione S-transferase family protein [uncultured Roseobacter sp.]|uniref:glutathione S-transferase family protein n=1 Tax=uncultured Roseobacter sp. TaxID=114847 RepID=UPI002606FC35|nr:glutathione S-transferase family protein [uncultured Roseobacter sp.]
MQRTLFQISGAPPSWRVRLGLAFKGIQVDIRTLTTSDREEGDFDIRKLNIRGTLPVLMDNDVSVHNSIAILAWLDRQYPQTPLFGATPGDALEIWQLVMTCYDDFREANRQLLTVVFASRGELPEKGSFEADMLETGATQAHVECRYLEARLSDGRPYLCGDHLSAAEALVYPEVRLIQRAAATKPKLMQAVGLGDMRQLYPYISTWMDRLEAMPEVAGTMPEHWAETLAVN